MDGYQGGVNDCDFVERDGAFACATCGKTARRKTHRNCFAKMPRPAPRVRGLGDRLARLLARLGITPRRWARLWGQPEATGCKPCEARKEVLNAAGDRVAKWWHYFR